MLPHPSVLHTSIGVYLSPTRLDPCALHPVSRATASRRATCSGHQSGSVMCSLGYIAELTAGGQQEEDERRLQPEVLNDTSLRWGGSEALSLPSHSLACRMSCLR